MMNLKNKATRRPHGFTLIELLVVIAVIGILAGMLLPVLGHVRNRARKVQSVAEAKQIALAWQQYYEEYVQWPSFAFEDMEVKIDASVADVLQGESPEGITDIDNRRGIQFIAFSRINAAGEPINAWGDVDATAGAADEQCYWVKFDTDYDNKVAAGAGGPPTNSVRKSVIVWTYDDDGEVLASWRR